MEHGYDDIDFVGEDVINDADLARLGINDRQDQLILMEAFKKKGYSQGNNMGPRRQVAYLLNYKTILGFREYIRVGNHNEGIKNPHETIFWKSHSFAFCKTRLKEKFIFLPCSWSILNICSWLSSFGLLLRICICVALLLLYRSLLMGFDNAEGIIKSPQLMHFTCAKAWLLL